MNLYLVRRTSDCDYNEYEAAVVCAETEDAARLTHPDGYSQWVNGAWDNWRGGEKWDPPDRVTVQLLGEAVEGLERSVVLAHEWGD